MKRGQEPAYPCKGQQIVTGVQSYSYVDEKGVTQAGQNNIFGEVVYNGISQRLLIDKDVMCAMLSNPVITELDLDTIITDTLTMTDTLLKREVESISKE